ncbi:MAG: DUF4249 domain-containing protein [Bacteroidales bacterium]|nr:DUF4249 domain-containing protein [Bacteroidales bacterium]
MLINKLKYDIIFPLALLLLNVVLTTCEERFTPDLDPKYENVMAVEGEITNQPGPYIVKLSSSVSFDVRQAVPLTGYFVEIEDDMGNSEVLTEIEKGVYTTSLYGMQGVVGRQYKINISATDGRTYTSDFELLRPPPSIDSVYVKVDYIVDNSLPYDLAGYRFYVNTQTPENEKSYYMWKLNATYEYSSDLIIRWMFDGQLHQFTNSDSLRYCWLTKDIYEYFLFNNENLLTTNVEGFPLHFVPVDVRDLSIRYSLLTTQYSLSKDAYIFWSNVKEQNENLGNLYTKQPFQIRGNLYNVNNGSEPVLGYFMVAGKSEKRIFVNRPNDPVVMRYGECKLVEQDYKNFGALFISSPAEWPEYATFDNNGISAYPPQECLDCQEKGGTIVKPDFWISD